MFLGSDRECTGGVSSITMELQKREKKHKEKRRSNEKRKERSRDAARCRRSREMDIFTELAAALPVPANQAAHLDKASVMRLAIAYLKVRAVVDSIPGAVTKSESSKEMDELFSKALNGFMLVLSSDGNMVYLSENVSDYLGVSQMDMMGQSVYEYSHPCDHEELREWLSSKPPDNNEKRSCSFFLRLKCTLTSKGRKVNLKSASYKVIHCIGRQTNIRDTNSNSVDVAKGTETSSTTDEEEEESAEIDGPSLILVGCPIPHPSNIEIPLGRHTFLSKYNLSMKFTYADEKLAEYLGWHSDELMGQSVFEFHHALDSLALDRSFKSLFSKGQCETVAYRFLGKRGGYAWVVTQATLIHCSKQQKPLSVVCVNYILSGVEREDEVYSVRQLLARDSNEKALTSEESATKLHSHVVESPVVQEAAGKAIAAAAVAAAAVTAPSSDPSSANSQTNRANKEIASTKLPDSQVQADSPSGSTPLRENRGILDAKRQQTVTAAIFRSSLIQQQQQPEKQQNHTEATKDRAIKRSEEKTETLKENDEPAPKRIARRHPVHSDFVFQGKPALEYDFEAALRRDRPQAVTSQLFAPLTNANNQQQQQQQTQQQEQQLSCRPPPQTATASIFAPRTEDMNKGFLTFSEDQPGLTMLKDEPEDLTHLAPTPGDVCVPLEDTPFLSDMLDEFILGNDNYCPLLSPGGPLMSELRATDLGEALKDADLGDSTIKNKCLGDPLANSDPFMYGDSPSSPCSIDPNAVSPSLMKYRQSPERSIDSLDSPTGGSAGDTLSEDEMLMLGISDNMADDELALRAPYIPMSDQDEALDLLMSDDMVMWGPSQPADKSSKWLIDDRDQRDVDSSLTQLLRTDQIVSRRCNDHGGSLVNPAQVLGQIPRRNVSVDQSERWSGALKTERSDRGNKRINTAFTELENDNKRIKCDASVGDLEAKETSFFLSDQPTNKSRRCSSKQSDSQLLRRLVTQQNFPRNLRAGTNESASFGGGTGTSCNFGVKVARRGRKTTVHSGTNSSSSSNNNNNNNNNNNANIEKDDEEDDAEGDAGGGGGDQRKIAVPSLQEDKTMGTSNTSTTRKSPYSSVLMNLLVSGCDEETVAALNSRNVSTTLGSKSLTTPLSVNLDNQLVPQCPAELGDTSSPSSLDRLSPNGTRRHLMGSLSGGSIISPSNGLISFDQLEYDVVGTTDAGLLQIGSGLLGVTALDRNLA